MGKKGVSRKGAEAEDREGTGRIGWLRWMIRMNGWEKRGVRAKGQKRDDRRRS